MRREIEGKITRMNQNRGKIIIMVRISLGGRSTWYILQRRGMTRNILLWPARVVQRRKNESENRKSNS